ncbi:MAG: phosphate acyltransferase [Prevotellaceae bacterium]|jgi:glycerol-3-phosphate acyltransferase PlsX|nr:phosphate acyltransferase [Prevotellaceae bacterium]
MKIGLDVMGGDFAPKNEVLGAIEALSELQGGSEMILFGDKTQIEAVCKEKGFDAAGFQIVHTTEVIGMHDHPARAFAQKPNSSMVTGFKYLSAGYIDGFASPGNTGAMMAGVMYTVKTIEGILRPCISCFYPIIDGRWGLLLDVGLNADCKPENLYQYAILGSLYAKGALGATNPRVALLNIGEEETKGNIVAKAAYEMMKGTKDFNFVGNLEGNELMTGEKADVVVCDGFVGNVILKTAESFYRLAAYQGIETDFFNRLNYEFHGGTPVLGVNAPVIIGHGSSSPKAIKNMILNTEKTVRAKMLDRVKDIFKNSSFTKNDNSL